MLPRVTITCDWSSIISMVRRWTGLVCDHNIIRMVRGGLAWSVTTTLSGWWEVDWPGLWHYQHGEEVDWTGLWPQHYQDGEEVDWTGLWRQHYQNGEEVDPTGLWPRHCQHGERWIGLVCDHNIVRIVRGGPDWSITMTLSEWWGGGPDWSVTTTLSAWWEVDRTGLWPRHYQHGKRWTALVCDHDIISMVRRWTGLVYDTNIFSMVRNMFFTSER